jgi:manganese-dependent inorganic pyrophosphatase
LALEYLYQHLDSFGYDNPQAVVVDPLNPETTYLFNKFGLEHSPQITADDIQSQDKVVLVDHNEESQRLPGLNPEQIVEIIDHHKPNLNFNEPLFLTFKTWGSSASIVYFLMKRAGQKPVKPSKKMAGLMLAAILSDTVGFKSATATDIDQELAQELAEIAGIDDLDAFALEIFKAKSNLDGLSAQELVRNDYKHYQFEQKVAIGQVETVEQEQILTNKKEELLQAMQEVKQADQVDHIFLAITDVLQVNTKLLITDETSAQVAEAAFGSQVTDGVLDIGPKLSRKKQIAPAIETALSS